MESITEKIPSFIELSGGYGNGNGYGNGFGLGNGSGYGNGFGLGNGSGSGNGFGSGFGSGNGFGSGFGSGDGNGSGYGYGNGSGYGDSNGYGEGYGNGSGYGDSNGYGNSGCTGIKEVNGLPIYNVDGVRTIITHIHGSIAEGYIVKNNVYLEHCYIAKGQGYFAHGETVRAACDALEEKIIANLDTDARIAKFKSKFALDRKYPAIDFYTWHSVLTGSCEQGRRAFAEEHGIDIEAAEYTVEEFINMTKNSFGGKIIHQLADELGMR